MSESSDYNLSYFVKKELSYKENIDYVIVINGHVNNPAIIFPELTNLKIIRRDNIGFDFGGHAAALEVIPEYDYYFFMNSGVIGPIMPHYCTEHWSSIFIRKINDKVKLVGTSIVCLPHTDAGGYGPKIEGFFFMVDKVGLSLLQNQKTIFCNHPNKFSAIVNGEYGLSTCIFKNGYTIDCMLKRYQGIDWTSPTNHTMNNNIHPSRENSFYGASINPYEVIFHKWFWHGCRTVNFNIIEQHIKST
jgi:hypothetical protein